MSRLAKVVIVDEVNCVIAGLSPDHISYFYEEYACRAPNYFFNPKFKLGQWDGKIRYFHKTGKTYVYLLETIVPQLTGLGYKIDLQDNRTSVVPTPPPVDKDIFKNFVHPDTQKPIELRSYQMNSVNSAIAANGGVIIAGTGAGKTIICATLCEVYGRYNIRTMTIVPSKDLIEQTAAEYQVCGLDAGRYYGEVKDVAHQHVVSTWQSLQNNPTLLQEFGMVIVDECHGIKGTVLTTLLNEKAAHIPLRFGVTGTLPKAETDAMAVRIAVGDVRYAITAKELMDQGVLAKLNIDILQLEENFMELYKEFLEEHTNPLEKPPTYKQFKDEYFPDYTSEKKYLQQNEKRMRWIADWISVKRDMGKGNVFCLVDGIRMGQKLADMIEGAIFVHGKDKAKARKQIYDLFKTNDNLVVIATIQIASTGLNIKRIFHLMFIDVGKSFIRVIQTIGRGLRKADDKDSVDVTDICSDLKYARKHLNERKKFYAEAQYPHKVKKIDYGTF